MIPVTKPYLPDINKFKSYVDKIYASGQLTNNGPLLQELKTRLEDSDVLNEINILNRE